MRETKVNTGFKCKCGSRQVHAILNKMGNSLGVRLYQEYLVKMKQILEEYEAKLKPLWEEYLAKKKQLWEEYEAKTK